MAEHINGTAGPEGHGLECEVGWLAPLLRQDSNHRELLHAAAEWDLHKGFGDVDGAPLDWSSSSSVPSYACKCCFSCESDYRVDSPQVGFLDGEGLSL